MQTKLINGPYSSIMNKQDLLREVVVKYIDYFYPVASGTSAVAIDNKIEQAMVSTALYFHCLRYQPVTADG
ncbi:Protein bunched, class 1/class 3/D/E isoforms [Papilio machaon]|uniref:Protein bunched, class 1/class 3/D/E isoforms n=1 Tax=Papilio machaon TaxID=76193 RepID=A0A194QV53_PAPMA|nr:Protein bunched, class 1/class 3/D/E isoforms [Papilio machaon]